MFNLAVSILILGMFLYLKIPYNIWLKLFSTPVISLPQTIYYISLIGIRVYKYELFEII